MMSAPQLFGFVIRSLLVSVMLVSLSACGGGGDFSDLQAKMAEIKARPRGRIEPPPEFAPIASVSYSVHQMRGPDTVMPPFGKHRILTGEEIDLIVDYIQTL